MAKFGKDYSLPNTLVKEVRKCVKICKNTTMKKMTKTRKKAMTIVSDYWNNKNIEERELILSNYFKLKVTVDKHKKKTYAKLPIHFRVWLKLVLLGWDD